MGKNQLIHGNEFHLLKQAEIHKATGKLVESLNLAAGSTGGFDLYKVVEGKLKYKNGLFADTAR